MMHSLATLLLAGLFVLVAFAQDVAISQQCIRTGFCFELNIPASTSRTGRGDVYFQIHARTNYNWVALGQGSGMADSNMFIMYLNGAGNNVTMSTRAGTAHTQPHHSDHAQITLLEGTGVHEGYMTANMRCSNCDRWPGGSMDFRGSNSDWIYAYKLGNPLHSDDLQHSIHRHDSSGHFIWLLDEAKGGDNANPFLVQAASSSQGTGSSTRITTSSSQFNRARLVEVHGIMAMLVFVVLFPVGGILIRLANFRGGIWVHVGVQLIAWLGAIAALGLGLYLAVNMSLLEVAEAHPIIGIILMVLILGQPIYGWLHHKAYKAHGRRTVWSWAHLSVGRIAIFGGMINGGLGLKLAGNATRYWLLRYGIVCGVIALLYIAAIIYGELRLRKVQPGKGTFRRFGQDDKQSTLLYSRSDEQGLSVPMKQRPFRLRRDDMMHQSTDSTEYAPLAAKELYQDDAGSRAGSRAASPARLSRAASPEPRSRAASTSRFGGNGTYDP